MARIALYWHNGRSLGHTARTAAIGQSLLAQRPGCSVLGITGASHGLELLPAGMDVVKVPSFRAYDEPGGVRTVPTLPLTYRELQHLREQLLAEAVAAFAPDVFVVDTNPQGRAGELIPTLGARRGRATMLGLRGVMGSAAETNTTLFSPSMARFILEYYTQLLVYTDPAVFDLEQAYTIPPSLRPLLLYTGYVARPESCSCVEARELLEVDQYERLVVISLGGGQGAEPIWHDLVTAAVGLRGQVDRVLLVTGPYLEHDAEVRIRTRVAEIPWFRWERMLPGLKTWMRAADLFVGGGGYNTLAEVLAMGVNALIIPRQISEREQEIHAGRLAAQGLIRLYSPEQHAPTALAGILHKCLEEPYPRADTPRPACNGADRAAMLITAGNSSTEVWR